MNAYMVTHAWQVEHLPRPERGQWRRRRSYFNRIWSPQLENHCLYEAIGYAVFGVDGRPGFGSLPTPSSMYWLETIYQGAGHDIAGSCSLLQDV